METQARIAVYLGMQNAGAAVTQDLDKNRPKTTQASGDRRIMRNDKTA